MFGRHAAVGVMKKGIVTPMRVVPSNIPGPEYRLTGKPHKMPQSIRIYTANEIVKIRKAARLARKILDFSLKHATPGMTTDELDQLCHAEILKHNAYPSPINYGGFPKAICTSVNDVVCHGIPDNRPLQEGDLLSVDVSVFTDGFHGDNCGSIVVGKAADDIPQRLVDVTRLALETSISKIGPGACLSVIGSTIEEIATKNKFSVVHEFVGHGTGEILHMAPYVSHCRNNDRLPLRPGMVFTIEPIIVEGSRALEGWDDGWTAVTEDGGWGAQFEHEVLITNYGVEILTVSED